jgi:rhamnosyltransferase
MSERIPGVIVTYFPDAKFETRLAAISRECTPVLIVDNSADAMVRERLLRAARTAGAELLVQERNRGIAGGLNAGFAALAERGYSSVIAFDQDSTPDRGCVAALAACAATSVTGPAVVGSNWSDEARPDHPARHVQSLRLLPLCFQRVPAHIDLRTVTFVINSGSWFDLANWRALEGFDENLFLDLVDVDFCLRTQSSGRRIAVAAGARMLHQRGQKRPIHRFGRIWWPAFMPPERLRSLMANRVRLLFRQGWSYPHWATYEVCYTAKLLWDILLLEDRKGSKLGSICRGVAAGLGNQRKAANWETLQSNR